MDKKIKPYRRLPTKPPGPKFQCCTKLYIASSALGFDFFCPPAPNAQPKGNIEIWGCCGDDIIPLYPSRSSVIPSRSLNSKHYGDSPLIAIATAIS